MRVAELRHWWDLFDHVIAVVDVLGHEGARMRSIDTDGPGRVDVEAGDVVVELRRKGEYKLRRRKELGVHYPHRGAVDVRFPDFDAGVRKRRGDQDGGRKVAVVSE